MTATLLERRQTQESLEEHGFNFAIDDPQLAKMAAISHQFSPKRLELASLADLSRIGKLAPVTIRDPKVDHDAKVAAQRAAGAIPVLDHQRAVQSILVAEIGGALRSEWLVASENRHRIARDQVEHEKRQHRDTQ